MYFPLVNIFSIVVEILPNKSQDQFLLYDLYHGFLYTVFARSQSISSDGSDLTILEYSDFSNKKD